MIFATREYWASAILQKAKEGRRNWSWSQHELMTRFMKSGTLLGMVGLSPLATAKAVWIGDLPLNGWGLFVISCHKINPNEYISELIEYDSWRITICEDILDGVREIFSIPNQLNCFQFIQVTYSQVPSIFETIKMQKLMRLK